jgi:membrane associated rhomboid family serine protease
VNPEQEMSERTTDYVEVATTESRYRARLWSLVLLAVGIPTLVEERENGLALLVPAAKGERAVRELSLFTEENRNWPPPRQFGEENLPSRRPPTVLVMGGLLVFYVVTGGASGGNPWFRAGEVDSRAILAQGEWWRLITALTLHADSVHLLGNLLLGGLVIHFLLKVYGTGLGLFLTLLAGGLGNYFNVLAHGPGHLSVGFSTAVFAAVGLLSGSQLNRQRFGGVILPLGAGLALLAMIGSEGERTDLGAHLWGLLVGLAFGLLFRLFRREPEPGARTGAWLQAGCLGLALLLVSTAWYLALAG